MARHFAANLVNLLIVAMVVLGGLIVWGKTEFTNPGPLSEPVEITVDRGARLDEVANDLAAKGAISNAHVFRLGARYTRQDTKLKFGEYELPANVSMAEVLDLISSGKGIAHQVTIPEGFSVFQVVARLGENELLTGDVAKLPAEGAIAPNTYAITRGDTRQSVINRMTQAQEKILAEAWNDRAPDLPLKSPQEALILASIIEKETGVNSERREVAAVFVNRLNKGMKLQTDPTVIYGITQGKEGLGRGLRRSELQKKTPYNTYVILGLPPGPIANPGKAAIEAAVNPISSEMLYFVADGTGGHAFAKTLPEHNVNVKKWRRIEAKLKRKQAQEAAEAAAVAAENN